MKNKNLLFSIILGAAVAVLIIVFLQMQKTSIETSARMVNVVVARRYIDQGTPVTKDMVTTIKIPSQYKQPKSVDKVENILNQQGGVLFVTTSPINANEQVMFTKLISLAQEGSLSINVPFEKRAVAVTISEPIWNYIKPGDFVDLILVTTLKKKTDNLSKIRVMPLIENVQVLAKGPSVFSMADTKKLAEKGLLGSGGMGTDNKLDNVIAVALTPEEAAFLTVANNQGKITIFLRGVNDTETIKLQPTDLDAWLIKKYGGDYSFGAAIGGSESSGGGYNPQNIKQMMEDVKSYIQ